MSLSLESIFKPLNDFFLEKYKTQEDSEILFRFDQLGSSVSDDDFTDEDHPDLGYIEGLVNEKFSYLVNRVPIDAGDGLNVLLSGHSIDSAYFARLMGPAQPFIAPDTDDASRDAMIGFFSTIKAGALKKWSELELASTATGLMLDFKPSYGTPESWFDKGKTDGWTSHSIEIKESSPPSEGLAVSPTRQLWRMKLDDSAMRAILDLPGDASPEAAASLPAPDLAERVLRTRDHRLATAHVADAFVAPAAISRPAIRDHRLGTAGVSVRDHRLGAAGIAGRAAVFGPAIRAGGGVTVAETITPVRPRRSVVLHDTQLRKLKGLDVRRRLEVLEVINDSAPTAPVTTDRITVSFEYCPVKIDRPWLVDTFITSGNWFIPGVPRGEVTSSGAGGMRLLPIGFVAVRKLTIEANWSEDDKQKASEATALGPFSVDADIVDGKLSHPGLQIVGWVLQRLPELPPRGSDA